MILLGLLSEKNGEFKSIGENIKDNFVKKFNKLNKG
jgi:hypothetical protein